MSIVDQNEAVEELSLDENQPDKVVVMAKTKSEDTDWVGIHLPDWQHAIYHMDEPKAKLHVPKNKGREAMAYLTYLIDHYNNLPSTIAFIHSHEKGFPAAWHTDAYGYDNVRSLNMLKIDHVQQTGYTSLRCIEEPGCPNEIQPFRAGKDEGLRHSETTMIDAWTQMFGKHSQIPDVIAATCCSQFAVSKAQALQRPRDDYIRFRKWLLDTKVDDATSGRVMEYLWHIFFGKEPVHCPDVEACYCEVYGRRCKS